MLKRGIAEMNIRQVSLSLSLVAPRAPSMDQGNGLLEPDRYATGIIIVFYADEAAQCSLSLSLSSSGCLLVCYFILLLWRSFNYGAQKKQDEPKEQYKYYLFRNG